MRKSSKGRDYKILCWKPNLGTTKMPGSGCTTAEERPHERWHLLGHLKSECRGDNRHCGGHWLMSSVPNHPAAEWFYAYFICISLNRTNGQQKRLLGNSPVYPPIGQCFFLPLLMGTSRPNCQHVSLRVWLSS
uniref:Uncharacterized protein n=1 Tax=Labrus bergylta TaxID=56723 RepID=A0A3Q3GMG7_9LABR